MSLKPLILATSLAAGGLCCAASAVAGSVPEGAPRQSAKRSADFADRHEESRKGRAWVSRGYRDARELPRGAKHDSTAAVPVEPTLQQLLDKQWGPGVLSASDDRLPGSQDSLWTVESSATTTLRFETGSNAPYNVFGIYDSSSPGSRLPLFYGFAGAGATSTLTVQSLEAGGFRFTSTVNGIAESALFGSSVFGFYLRTPDNVFFSDTALNTDQADHLYAYRGRNPGKGEDFVFPGGSYLLAWEDMLNGGDRDFQDLVIGISGISPAHASPVPLPAGALLLGSGLLGLLGLRRRQSAMAPQ